MGGSVAVTVRKKDGTVVPMCRWTNSLSYWIKSKKFLTDPTAVMESFIEAGKESPYNQEDSLVAPEGYGLVVIDLKTETILTYQDYTSFDFDFGKAGFSLDLHLWDILNFKLEDSPIPL